ncbi:hypothetical protein U91I_02710 [alpha proteobacterium U9-1i]|nr:hypothetical protein U91I_02710 [alpha proteobacterium U9-1i]
MSEAGKVPVRESVGAALRVVRENVGFVGAVALAGAAGLALITLLTGLSRPLGLLLGVVAWGISAAAYGALTQMTLSGVADARAKLFANAMRVWGAMIVVGFFMALVSMVLVIALSVALGPVLVPYASELQAVGQDQAAGLALLMRMLDQNPAPFAFAALLFGAVWLMLTSRLYLAAPASVDRGRILSFETWNWTKGSMLRICAARLILLAPAYVLVSALGTLSGAVMGADLTTPAGLMSFAQGSVIGAAAYVFINNFVNIAIYSALEAGLSAYLYLGLRPAEAAATVSPSTDSGPLG